MKQSRFLVSMVLAFSVAACASDSTPSPSKSENSVTSDATVGSDRATKVDQFSFIKPAPNCGEVPGTRAFVTRPPANGVATIEKTLDFSPYPPGNSSAACNSRRVPVWVVIYRSKPGFSGADSFGYDKSFANGLTIHATINITVKR